VNDAGPAGAAVPLLQGILVNLKFLHFLQEKRKAERPSARLGSFTLRAQNFKVFPVINISTFREDHNDYWFKLQLPFIRSHGKHPSKALG
jgi:hypothetical protein